MTRGAALRDRISAGILDMAAAVLADRADASMADIAEAAGVGRATLYRYFPSREELLRGLAQAAIEELGQAIAAAGLETVPVREGIARVTRAFVAAGGKYVALARLRPEKEPGVERPVTEPVLELFRRGAADGTLRGDVPSEVLLELYRGLLEASLRLAGRDGLGVERTSAAVLSVFLTGALAAPPVGR